MNVLVIGQKDNGPVLQRTVTPAEFFNAWGPFADRLWMEARRKTVVIDGCKVRLVLVP